MHCNSNSKVHQPNHDPDEISSFLAETVDENDKETQVPKEDFLESNYEAVVHPLAQARDTFKISTSSKSSWQCS